MGGFYFRRVITLRGSCFQRVDTLGGGGSLLSESPYFWGSVVTFGGSLHWMGGGGRYFRRVVTLGGVVTLGASLLSEGRYFGGFVTFGASLLWGDSRPSILLGSVK